MEDGDLQTLGIIDYDKRLSHNFTAHPKIDPHTGKSKVILSLGYPSILSHLILGPQLLD
jgi:carotenoid cleavage dioxygenase